MWRIRSQTDAHSWIVVWRPGTFFLEQKTPEHASIILSWVHTLLVTSCEHYFWGIMKVKKIIVPHLMFFASPRLPSSLFFVMACLSIPRRARSWPKRWNIEQFYENVSQTPKSSLRFPNVAYFRFGVGPASLSSVMVSDFMLPHGQAEYSASGSRWGSPRMPM